MRVCIVIRWRICLCEGVRLSVWGFVSVCRVMVKIKGVWGPNVTGNLYAKLVSPDNINQTQIILLPFGTKWLQF